MKIKLNDELYAEYAHSFLKWLRKWIEESVKDAKGLKKTAKAGLADTLVWNMACLLDGSGELKHGDRLMVPFLGFQANKKKEVVFDEGGVALHELIGFDEAEVEEDHDETDLPEKRPEDPGLDQCFSITLCFGSGIQQTMNIWKSQPRSELVDAVGSSLSFLVTGGDLTKNANIRDVVGKMCPAFRRIDRVEFWDHHDHRFSMKGDGLAGLTIEKLANRIHDHLHKGPLWALEQK